MRAVESEARGDTSPATSTNMFVQGYESLARLPSAALRMFRDASQVCMRVSPICEVLI